MGDTGSPFIRVSEPYVAPDAGRLVSEAISGGWLSSGGPFARRFSAALSEAYNGSKIILTNSGTSALEIALRAVGRATGAVRGQIILPAYTISDAAAAVLRAGYVPVYADVAADRFCLTAHTLRAAYDSASRPVGVLITHLYGMGADLSVYDAARRMGLFIIDDACEAFGVTVSGMTMPDLSDATCVSLRGEKLMPVGAGGFIATRHEGIAGLAQAFIGMNSPRGVQRYRSVDLGYSYEFPELLSAFGLAQVAHFGATIMDRWAIANGYLSYGLPQVYRAGDVPWKFPVFVPDHRAAYEFFAKRGIETSPPFVPLYQLPAIARYGEAGPPQMALPVSEMLASKLLLLPLHSHMRAEDVDRVFAAYEELVKAGQ